MCCNDTPSCTGSSIATGKGFHARQIGGERPGKEATHWSFRSAGGLGGRLTNMLHKT